MHDTFIANARKKPQTRNDTCQELVLKKILIIKCQKDNLDYTKVGKK
jgi:hypothetical protein